MAPTPGPWGGPHGTLPPLIAANLRSLMKTTSALFVIATLALATQVFAAPAAAAGPVCAFTAPEGFQGRVVKWVGECQNGKAHGIGVLRGYPKAHDTEGHIVVFYGALEQGQPVIGVIETADGYLVGRFSAGKVHPFEERNDSIVAFDRAAEAATLASKRFQAAGNKEAAAFYTKKAQELAQQMD